MIIASKTGWLISAEFISEDVDTITVKAYDEKNKRVIKKSDDSVKVFDDVSEAVNWIEE